MFKLPAHIHCPFIRDVARRRCSAVPCARRQVRGRKACIFRPLMDVTDRQHIHRLCSDRQDTLDLDPCYIWTLFQLIHDIFFFFLRGSIGTKIGGNIP